VRGQVFEPSMERVPSASTALAPGTHSCNRNAGEDIPDAGNAPKVFAISRLLDSPPKLSPDVTRVQT
jgi:hypothetical protein